MSDIRKSDSNQGVDRKEAMKALRHDMKKEHECLEENQHCANARKGILASMQSVMSLDKEYFTKFYKDHQVFAVNFSDYKYVEELCALICAAESWYTLPGDNLPGDPDDPYGDIGWIGGLNLHIHASLYFGFTRKEMLRLFQILQEVKEMEINDLALPGYIIPNVELKDSEDWMLYYVAAVVVKCKAAILHFESRREELGISAELRDDIVGAIRTTYWWKHMMMSRVIDFSTEGLPPEVLERI